jgi:hypothetical protein
MRSFEIALGAVALAATATATIATGVGDARADICPGFTVALTCEGHNGCDLVESVTGACRVDCVSETSEAEVKPYYADTCAAQNAAVRYPTTMQDFIVHAELGTVVRTGRCNQDTYLAQDAAVGAHCAPGERIYYVEFPTFHAFDFSEAQYAAHRAPYVEMITYGVMNHRGLVHLGKNGSIVHLDPAVLAASAPARAGLQPFITARDPYGVYRTGYFAALGYTWPNEGGNFVAAYYPAWNGKARRLRNVHTGRCAQVIRADGYDDETRDCSGSFLQGDYFFASPALATGTTLASPVTPVGGTWYTVRSRGNIDRCLRAGWDFAACDGTDAQKHRLNPKSSAWQLESRSPGGNCARDDLFSDEIINWGCSDFLDLEPGRKRWYLEPQ